MFSWSLLEIPCHIDHLTHIHLPYQHMNLSVTKDMRNGNLRKSIVGSATLILLTASIKNIKKEVFIIFISSQDSEEISCTMPNVSFQTQFELLRPTLNYLNTHFGNLQ